MRRAAVVLALLLALLAPAVASADNGQQTTLLLTPSGQPVGGVWQRWMNDSYMPTYNGSMVLDLGSASMCGSTDDAATVACTAPSGFTPDLTASVASYPETLVSPAGANLERWELLYEQGHVVDLADLTDVERSTFLEIWHQRQPPAGESMSSWWFPTGYQSTSWYATRNVYGEWFADDFALCAMLPKWTLAVAGALNDPLSDDGFAGMADLGNLNWVRRRGRLVEVGRITSRDRWALRTQSESCGLIRSWLSASYTG